jgi:tetratricopeptide (TPR) repeat protein
MKIFVLSMSAILCATFSGIAQSYDSLVRYQELTYSSAFERQVFEAAKKGKADAFSLMMANGNLLTETRINESRTLFYEYIRTFKLDDIKKNEKKIKTIHDNLEKRFLKKFEMECRFEQVFHNGYFNSLSATAIYALTFDEFKIPYTIMEQADQVYLIVYPLTDKIIIRNAPEMGGYFVLNDEFKTAYLNRLKEQKLIDPQEYAASSTADLFDKYYFGQGGDVTLTRLAALQYMNEALVLSQQNKYEQSYALLQKAYVLYPSDRIGYLLMFSGVRAFATRKTKDSTHAAYLNQITRFTDFGIDTEMIKHDFELAIQELLFDKNTKPKLDIYYRVLVRGLDNIQVTNELDFLYQYHVTRYYYNLGKFRDAMPYAERALVIKPVDVDCQASMVELLRKFVSTSSAQAGLTTVEKYNTQFESLRQNNTFNSLLGTLYLFHFYQEYVAGKPAEGDKYKLLYEGIATKYNELSISPSLVGQAYSGAAIFYYRKGQVAKARQLIATGLKFAPDSFELKQRQQMIK